MSTKTIFKNDRVVLMKEFDKLTVGTIYEVANIVNTYVILRDPVTKVAACAVDVKDFFEYFVKESRKWTSWAGTINSEGKIIGWYRTNGKKVQFKTICTIYGNFRGEATCNKTDQFSLYIGLNIAISRAYSKIISKGIVEINKKLDNFNADYKDITDNIANLIKQSKPIEMVGFKESTEKELIETVETEVQD